MSRGIEYFRFFRPTFPEGREMGDSGHARGNDCDTRCGGRRRLLIHDDESFDISRRRDAEKNARIRHFLVTGRKKRSEGLSFIMTPLQTAGRWIYKERVPFSQRKEMERFRFPIAGSNDRYRNRIPNRHPAPDDDSGAPFSRRSSSVSPVSRRSFSWGPSSALPSSRRSSEPPSSLAWGR